MHSRITVCGMQNCASCQTRHMCSDAPASSFPARPQMPQAGIVMCYSLIKYALRHLCQWHTVHERHIMRGSILGHSVAWSRGHMSAQLACRTDSKSILPKHTVTSLIRYTLEADSNCDCLGNSAPKYINNRIAHSQFHL